MKEKFAVAEDLFTGYTVLYNLDTGLTSVHCDRCSEWVYESDRTEKMDALELYECVINAHKSETVKFK